MKRRLAAVFALDVVGYSRLMGADDEGTLARLNAVRRELVQPRIDDYRGRIVKLTGDGLLAEFASIVDAVQCAVDIQQAMALRETDRADDQRIALRIGVNLGDIIVEGGDIFGDGVNVAARLEGLAEPNGICVSGKVHEEIRSKIGATFQDLGNREVKNIDRPVHVWSWQPDAADRILSVTDRDQRQQTIEKPSIAIMPFTNMSGDPQQEFFADGITEDIIIDLSQLPEMRTAARSSSFAYKNASKTVQQLSREIGARYILSGSVRKSGERVRITAQLVDGPSGDHIWAERYDRQLVDIFDLQSEIATHIVQSLTGRIVDQPGKNTRDVAAPNIDAYEGYIRARPLLREMSRRGVETALKMFTDSIRIDPHYALAHCGVSDAAGILAFHYEDSAGYGKMAIDHALKALEINPELAEAHGSYGSALKAANDRSGAEREFRAAISLAPNSYDVYIDLGLLYLTGNNAERALPLMQKAYDLANQDLHTAMMLLGTLRALSRKALLSDLAGATLGYCENRLRLNRNDEQAAYVGAMALFDLGDLERARDWADHAASVTNEDGRTSYNLACAYGLIGDIDNALIHLEKTLTLGCSQVKVRWMHLDADLRLVRKDPRFEATLEKYS